jgi:single-strand DNA-binding protein
MNSVNLIGNLTRDPELRTTPSGTSVASLRIAVNDRKPDSSGEWVDVPYYFDVTVWGRKAENAAQYLAKGNKVAVSGKLTWREWEAQDGTKRQSVEVNAFDLDFLTPRNSDGGGNGNGGGNQFVPSGRVDVRRRLLRRRRRHPVLIVERGICTNHRCQRFEHAVPCTPGDRCSSCGLQLDHETGLTWDDAARAGYRSPTTDEGSTGVARTV